MNEAIVSPEYAWVVAAIFYVVFFGFVGGALYRRKRAIVAASHEKPPREVLIRNALTDWLQEATVVKAMNLAGLATLGQLQATLLLLPAMDEKKLLGTCRALLADRQVRRVIAAYMKRRYGAEIGEVLAALRDYAGPLMETG